MRFRVNTLLLAAGLTLWALPAVWSQDAGQSTPPQSTQPQSAQPQTAQPQGGQQQADRSAPADDAKSEAVTGCLSKDASGAFVLTDEATGAKTTVTGVADLEKHSDNHKVTLTGKMGTDAAGKPIFEATKLHQVSTTCKAGAQ